MENSNKLEIIVATANLGKLREIRAVCEDILVSFKSLKDIWPDPPDIPETGSTFEENAAMKAEWVFSRKRTWTLADDSGLEVDALSGEPGVYSSRYAGEDQDNEKNIQKLLENLDGVASAQRSARFRCAMVLLGPDIDRCTVGGVCEGAITFTPRGSGGFGYDPIFIPEGYARTFAEMDRAEKNSISHRGKALSALKEELYGIFSKS